MFPSERNFSAAFRTLAFSKAIECIMCPLMLAASNLEAGKRVAISNALSTLANVSSGDSF
jgi:hypothetical protein